MEHDHYMSKICELLIEAGLPERIRVDPDTFKAYPRGEDRQGLFQILPARWIVSEPVTEIGYEGITVHWEIEKPGYLVLHCEPYPRIGKKKDHDPDVIAALRDIKARITRRLREAFAADPKGSNEFDTDLVRQLNNFSGNKVLGFDLGLFKGHEPEDAVTALVDLVGHYSPVIDSVMVKILS